MNQVERFQALMAFQPVDRLPRWEWAMWWDLTIDRWHDEGLPRDLKFNQVFEIAQYVSEVAERVHRNLNELGGSTCSQTPDGSSVMLICGPILQ